MRNAVIVSGKYSQEKQKILLRASPQEENKAL
jgi:hypothetical protein